MLRIIAIGLFVLCLSCGGKKEGTPMTLDELRSFQIKQVLFDGDPSETGTAEIEVHLFDADTNESVLCSGVEHGMQTVQNKGTDYTGLDANFILTRGHSQTGVERFYIAVLERDSEQCPGDTSPEVDTVLARSNPLNKEDLQNQTIRLDEKNNGTISLVKRGELGAAMTAGDLLKARLKSVFLKSLPTNGQRPNVEVHLMDVLNNRSLACMGGEEGQLKRVTKSLTDYDHLYASAQLSARIAQSEKAQLLRAVLVHRSEGSCPQPFAVSVDRILGTTATFSFDQLRQGIALAFPHDEGQLEFVDGESHRASLNVSAPIADLLALKISKLRFAGDFGEFSSPEIEVHLFDPYTNATIACAGDPQGLGGVDDKERLYENLTVPLVRVWNRSEDPFGLVGVAIVERDAAACPEAASRSGNDYLAETVIPFDRLTAAEVTFENGSRVAFSR